MADLNDVLQLTDSIGEAFHHLVKQYKQGTAVPAPSYSDRLSAFRQYVDSQITDLEKKAALLKAINSAFAESDYQRGAARQLESLLQKLFTVYGIVSILETGNEYVYPEFAELCRFNFFAFPPARTFAPADKIFGLSTGYAAMGAGEIKDGGGLWLEFTDGAAIDIAKYRGGKLGLISDVKGVNDLNIKVWVKKWDGTIDKVPMTIPAETTGFIGFLSDTILYNDVTNIEYISGGSVGDKMHIASYRWRGSPS